MTKKNESLSRSERREAMRAIWAENPVAFEPEIWRKGWQKPVEGENGYTWTLVSWPEGSDLGWFAEKAAREMNAAEKTPFPLDVCDLAFSLRRIYVLEQMGLVADPESVNLMRQIEAQLPDDAKASDILDQAMVFIAGLSKLRMGGFGARMASSIKNDRLGFPCFKPVP